MRRVRSSLSARVVVGLLAVLLACPAFAAVLNKRARLREGPSRLTPLIGWVESGTSVEILEEAAGWYHVTNPDGRQGFIWGAHLDGLPADPNAADSGAPTLQDEMRALRNEIAALEGDGSRGDDLEQIGRRIDALAETQRELSALIEASSPSVATPMDGTAVAAGAFLTVGAVLGWIAARLTQGRRERRGRIRV